MRLSLNLTKKEAAIFDSRLFCFCLSPDTYSVKR